MDISVKPEKIKEYAKRMQTKISEMRECLEVATLEMNKTSDSFEGLGAREFLNQYMSLKTRFDDFYAVMGSYAEFLLKTAIKYEELDQNISKSAAEQLTSNIK